MGALFMHVLLKPVNRSGAPVLIRKGQEVRVGSTEWADRSFPGDPELLGIHMVVSFSGERPTVTAMDQAVVSLNGKERTSANLRDGQQLQAGQTVFTVVVEGVEEEPSGKDDPSGRSSADVDEADEPLELQPIDLEQDFAMLAMPPLERQPDASAELPDLIAAFVAADRHLDAVQFLGWVLPPPVNLQWLTESVERLSPDLNAEEQRVLEVARSWCEDNDPAWTAEAESLATRVPQDRAAWWVTQALLWCPAEQPGSGETPPSAEAPAFQPPRNLPPTASRGLVTTLAYGLTDHSPEDIMQDCLAAGLALACG